MIYCKALLSFARGFKHMIWFWITCQTHISPTVSEYLNNVRRIMKSIWLLYLIPTKWVIYIIMKSRLANSDFHAWFTKLQLHNQQMSNMGVLWRISWYFPRYWPFVWGIHRSPMNSPHRVQWRGALIFSLVCARINGWVNNREACDLGRHCAHYDVIVMICHENPRQSFEYRCVIFRLFRYYMRVTM